MYIDLDIDVVDLDSRATLLDLNEIEGLIPTHIQFKHELNEWEQSNILDASVWSKKINLTIENFSTIDFCLKLHKKMFNKTWRWAGDLRKTNKNIGIFWLDIRENLKNLYEDLKFQVKNNSYSLTEIAIRFHHRLVYIHPFPNGNGRHARLSTDILLRILGEKKFSWGKSNLADPNDIRMQYVKALQLADLGDYSKLIEFSLS